MQTQSITHAWRASAIALGAALAMAHAASAAPAPLVVKTATGSVQGAVAGPVLSFKGIPFAQPPVGALRWRPPQPVKAWTGVKAATAYGADCMQKPFPGDAAPLGETPAEDCLYLNVWKPAEASSAKLPVMVWIYGGGFVNGGASPAVYDGSQFAKQGVIMVSANYRVGRFGFFAHPALTAEAKGGEPLGNYGHMDQIAALQWVKQNIAAFGGDPNNVTIVGESAGGGSVLTLVTSPLSQGLFQKAVVESGGGRGYLLPARKLSQDQPGLPSAESVGVTFGKANGVTGTDAAALAALRAIPAEQVTNGLNMATMATDTYVGGPIEDGKLIVEPPNVAIAAGRAAKVPIIIGANSADLGMNRSADKDALFNGFGAQAAAARAAYDPDGSAQVRALVSAVGADQTMVEPARLVSQLFAQQGLPAYEFRFSYVAESIRAGGRGAGHATEIPFAFDTVAARYGDKLTANDEAAAKAMNAYWVSFVKTGVPSAPGLPAWPRYSPGSDMLLNFTNTGPVAQADPWKPRLDAVAASAH